MYVLLFYNYIIYKAIPCKKLISKDIAIGLLIYIKDPKFPVIILPLIYLNKLAATF